MHLVLALAGGVLHAIGVLVTVAWWVWFLEPRPAELPFPPVLLVGLAGFAALQALVIASITAMLLALRRGASKWAMALAVSLPALEVVAGLLTFITPVLAMPLLSLAGALGGAHLLARRARGAGRHAGA